MRVQIINNSSVFSLPKFRNKGENNTYRIDTWKVKCFLCLHRLSGEYDLDCSPMGLFTFPTKDLLETLIKAKTCATKVTHAALLKEENLTRKKKG